MNIGDKLYKPVSRVDYAAAAGWCNVNNAHIEDRGDYFEIAANPPPEVTAADYDRAMEAHLAAERVARGYTSREPDVYAGSAVPRWAQDAADWIAHRDAVMLYGLDVINHYEETGEAPTLDEFKDGLPVIHWTFSEA